MATAKELLAQKLKQNTQKHQLAQKDNIKELFRVIEVDEL